MKKFSNRILLAAIILLTSACTRGPQDHFIFNELENPLIRQTRIDGAGEKSFEARSEEKGLILKGREFSGSEAEYANLKVKLQFTVRNAFGTFTSSYPGMISKTVACPAALQPEKIENPATGATGFLTKANDRLSFGICDEKEIKFDLAYFVIKCRNHFYEIKAYLPTETGGATDLRQLFHGFRCVN